MNQAFLPPDLQRRIDDEIEPGETLRWAGQPDRGRMARMGTCPALFGIPFTLFALVWMGMAGGIGSLIGHATQTVSPGSPFEFFPLLGLLGVPFVLVGLGLMLSPLWLSLKAARTVYAVTDRRVLLFEGSLWRGATVRSLGAAQVADRSRTQQADGSGDLIFNRLTSVSYDSDGDRRVSKVGFYGIPDVKTVDDLIQQAFGGRA